jgi:hypothetical protein
MSRRKVTELQFGSDSFLDVVCNLVGILIILIVVAGVRISKAPASAFLGPNLAPKFLSQLPPASLDGLREAADRISSTEELEPTIDASPQFTTSVEDDTPALRQQIAAVEREEQSLGAQLHQSLEQLTAAHEQQVTITEKVDHVRAALDVSETNLKNAQQSTAATSAEITTLKEQAAQLAVQLRTMQLEPEKAQRLEHRITPVGRTVTGEELHFRVERNRVAVIPLESLLKRLKEQIDRRKDWLAKAQQHEGQVGPIDGFSLKYVVVRDNLSVVDELRYGPGTYRISVAQWQLDLDRSALTETVEQALKPGSRFYQVLLEAKSESALTFWVYPDSFEAFARLKTFCHEQNFLVAGRPLPAGMPISGSPHGSHSSGQ